MMVYLKCLSGNESFAKSFNPNVEGSFPVGFYQFIYVQLKKYKNNEFVKFELSFGRSTVQGTLFDEPLIEFK